MQQAETNKADQGGNNGNISGGAVITKQFKSCLLLSMWEHLAEISIMYKH